MTDQSSAVQLQFQQGITHRLWKQWPVRILFDSPLYIPISFSICTGFHNQT